MQSDKIRVAVLFGGKSAEHEVSLQSAKNVIQNLDPKRYDVVPIGIDKQGNWFMGQDVFAQSIDHNHVPQISANNAAWFTPEWIGKNAIQANSTSHAVEKTNGAFFDVVFPAMHGTSCEDGTLQGLLELAGLPYVGCGVLSSAIGMDKDIAKKLVAAAGVTVAPYLAVKHGRWLQQPNVIMHEVLDVLAYPVFVKPANTGSSVGITKVKRPEDLAAAIDTAFRFDTKILIEKALRVVELEIAVLESAKAGDDPIISVVGEIKPSHEFYSYEAKYLDDNGAELIIPASVSAEIREEAQVMANTIFQALECDGMARIDLFYDLDRKEIVFNEINTLPGFTQISMYPKLMAATGISYTELLTRLITLAIKRHEQKGQLIRSYA